MSKYEYHPNPRTNGDTGVYTIEKGIDSGLVGIIVGGVFLVGISVVSYLWGKARGRNTTLKEELVKRNIIDGKSHDSSGNTLSDVHFSP